MRTTTALMLATALAAVQPASAELRKFEMNIEEVEIQVAPDLKVNAWAYNGQVPGPLLQVNEGDEVEVTVNNLTTLNHTIHWHGIPQSGSWQMDGVPDHTQLGVEPGESFTYRFVADRVGSLWYHCHVNVSEHIDLRGMWGPLVVRPKKPSALEKRVTKEAILMFSGWSSATASKYGEGGHPGELMDFFSINGKSFPLNQPLRVKKGDVLRLRLYAPNIPVAFHVHGHDMLVTHKDGLPLASPYGADVVPMSPGERYDVIIEANNPGIWMTHDHIEHHVTNAGKHHTGSMLVIEYEGVEAKDYYHWKHIAYDPDFYMSESLRKGPGLHDNDSHRGKELAP